MTTEGKTTGARYYMLQNSTGLVIMKVLLEDVERFEKAWSDQVIATGYSLYDVLSGTRWQDQVKREDDDFTPGNVR